MATIAFDLDNHLPFRYIKSPKPTISTIATSWLMISTQELASMLNIAETTVKRWSDEGIVPCVRTPGGHRKFHLTDIARFAERNGYTILGSVPPPMTASQREKLEVGVHTKDYGRIAEVFEEEALQADQNGMLELLLYLHKHQIAFPTIADEVVRPAFRSIGLNWKEGGIEVSQEHAASSALSAVLARMAPEMYRKEPNGLSAVCACPEGELHENGLRSVSYALETEGWSVDFIGANTPLDSLISFVRTKRIDLVCLSISTPQSRDKLASATRKLKSLTHSQDGRLVVGGSFAETEHDIKLQCDFVARSTREMLAYVRDVFRLKPGPKKNSPRHT